MSFGFIETDLMFKLVVALIGPFKQLTSVHCVYYPFN